MSDPTYKKIELVGTSSQSYADATRNALKKASATLHGISWFEVSEMRGHVNAQGEVDQFQVVLKVGMKLD